MRGIVRRVVEGAAVALGVTAVLGVVQRPQTARSSLDRTVAWLGGLDDSLRELCWVAAIGLAVLASVVAVLGSRQTRYDGTSFWEFELRMPSWPTTLFGCSVVLALLAAGIQLCEHRNIWGLVPLLLALWIFTRFLALLSRGWQLFFGPPSHF